MDQNLFEFSTGNFHDVGPIFFGPLFDETEQQGFENEDTVGINAPQEQLIERYEGTLGDPVSLVVNCIQIFFEEDWKLQEYKIYFNPNVDTRIKNEMLIKHKSFFGEYIFDGSTIYSFVKYELKKFTIYEHCGPNDSLVMITINHQCEVEKSDITKIPIVVQFLQNCLSHSELLKDGFCFYEPEATTTNTRLGIQHWPGYKFGIGQFDSHLTLHIEQRNKFKIAESVLDLLHVSCGDNRKRIPSLMNNFKASIIGTVVLTSYSNKLYKIQSVNENLNIYSTFINEDGSRISYKDYYKQRWNITGLDSTQPMLKTSKHDGFGTLYLVPELCTITGLTDIKGNKHLVRKEFTQYTNDGPNKKIFKYNQLISKLHCTPKFIEALNSWKLYLGRQFIRVPGRILPSIQLNGLTQVIHIGSQGNWSDELNSFEMFSTPKVESWVVLTPQEYFVEVKLFVNVLRIVAERMALHLPVPEIVQMNDAYQRTYMNHLDEILKKNDTCFILCVIRSLHSELYKKINRKLCTEAAVPSQLMSLKQIRINSLSFYTKTAIKMNCKLGGVPWSVTDFPRENFMVVGMNIYPDLSNKQKYYCAVMVSTDDTYTRYFSFVKSLSEQNISDYFIWCITKALRMWIDENQILPVATIIYRDGFQYNASPQTSCIVEIELIKEKCSKFYNGILFPFAYISVLKSDEIKFFTQNGRFGYKNPIPGTIVDSHITDTIMYDFFLISHSVKSGTVPPTYYRLLFSSIPFCTIDQVQTYTHILTHMYFNSQHSIRVPAPCQLAYKLAYFCANTLKSTKDIQLHGFPFFF